MLRNTDFFAAIKDGHFNQVKEMLDQGTDVNAIGEFQYSPLMVAGMYGHIEIVKLLAQRGADMHARCQYYQTPLIATVNHCTASCKEEIVRYLFTKGAGIHDRDFLASTPLIRAAFRGDKEIVAFFLENGADIDAMSLEGNALMQAIIGNHQAVLLLLLEKNVNLHAVNKHGYDALVLATHLNRKEMIPHLQQALSKNQRASSFQLRLEQTSYQGKIPSDFICPISHEIMNDPVTTSSGITYDRQSLIDWFASNKNPQAMQCLLTFKLILFKELKYATNIILKNQIERFISKKEAGENKIVDVDNKEQIRKKRIAHLNKLFQEKKEQNADCPKGNDFNLKC